MPKKGVKDDIRVIKLAFIGVIASVGGWAVFQGINELFNLENLQPFTLIFLGLGITWGLYYFGFDKLFKK